MLSRDRCAAHLREIESAYRPCMLQYGTHIPAASVRSVSDVHGIERGGLPRALEARGGEICRVGPVVEKETTLEVEQMNKVSMPSELFLDAGVDADRRLGRVASVNEPRAVVVGTCGACSGVFEDAGTDIAGSLCAHFSGCGEIALSSGLEGGSVSSSRASVCWTAGWKVSRHSALRVLGDRMSFRVISGSLHPPHLTCALWPMHCFCAKSQTAGSQVIVGGWMLSCVLNNA